MKKVYLITALSGLLLASCANDDLVVKQDVNSGGSDGAIAFNMKVGNQSRATGLEEVTNNFGVWSIKANDDAAFANLTLGLGTEAMSPNVVIDDYKVYYDDASHYGSQWTYYTSDNPDNIPELQYLKYWDGSFTNNYFFGYAPHNTKHKGALVALTNGTSDDKAVLTFNNVKTTSDPNYKFLYSDAEVATVADYINPANGSTTDPKKVELKFNFLLGQVRLAFWESIQGYSVELESVEFEEDLVNHPGAKLEFGVAGIPANYSGAPKAYSLGKYAEGGAGTASTVTYTGAKYADKDIAFTGVELSTASTYLDFAIPTGDISTLKASPTLSPTTYNVVPNADASVSPVVENCGFQFVLNYTLKADDTNEVIHVKGARVFVPDTYTQWDRNTVYTYVFQITKNSSGTTTTTKPDLDPEDPKDALYPIIFDGLTVTDPSTNETHWVVNQTLAFAKDVYVVKEGESLTDGVTINLGYDVSDDNTDGKVYWTSSNTSGFTVTNSETTIAHTSGTNTITGVTDGTYTLTANYYGTKATTNVVVGTWGSLADQNKRVEDPAFNLAAPITLTDTDPHIVWTSSDPTVATVEYATDASGNQVGKVTPLAAGTTTITATLGNKTATCTVTVEDLTVSTYAITSLVTDAPVQLTVTYNDGTTTTDVTSTATYSVSPTGVVSVSTAGLVTPEGAGTATITVEYNSASGLSFTRTVEARVNKVIP